MDRGHRRVPFEHGQRFPAAHALDGLDVDWAIGHDAMAGPMVPPVVDPEVLDAGAPARGLVRLGNRVAAGQLVVSGVGVGLAEPVTEHVAGVGASLPFPQFDERVEHSRLHRHRPGLAVLGPVEVDGLRSEIDVLPCQLQRLLRPASLEAQHQRDRPDMRRIGAKQGLSLRHVQELDAFVAVADGRQGNAGKPPFIGCVVHHRLGNLAEAIDGGRLAARTSDGLEPGPSVLDVDEGVVAHNAAKLADPPCVQAMDASGAVEVKDAGVGKRQVPFPPCTTVKELVPDLRFERG